MRIRWSPSCSLRRQIQAKLLLHFCTKFFVRLPIALKLFQLLKNLHEDVLCQVFLGSTPWKICAHNTDHGRIQELRQRMGGILVLVSYSLQAIFDV